MPRVRPSDYNRYSLIIVTLEGNVAPMPNEPQHKAPANTTTTQPTPPIPLKAAATSRGQHAAAHFSPAAQPADAPKEKKPRRVGRVFLIVFAVLVALTLGAYGAGVYVFSHHYYPGTTIAGIDVSMLDATEAATSLTNETSAYTLTVEGDGFTWSYSPESTDEVFDMQKAAESVLEANDALAWPIHLAAALSNDGHSTKEEPETATIDLDAEIDRSLFAPTFDEEAFVSDVQTAVDTFNEQRSGAFDAASSYDAEAAAFTVEQARSNEKLNRDNVAQLALASLARLDTAASLDELGADAFEPLAGGLTDDELAEACDAANELLGCNVSFKLGSSVAATLDGSTIAGWITFDESLTPTLNQEALTTWAQQLGQSFNTVGTERTYTRPDGKQITVSGGTFGWTVNVDAVVQAVQTAVAEHQTGEIDLPCTTTGDVYTGAGQPDWGAYIDVDISEQRARYYDASGTLLWETGVVTGKPDGENNTPTGLYKINNKLRNITLVGQKDPETGEPEYESPVDYWIAFIGSSIGFHDASWQNPSVYNNPKAYRWAGSHGCINTPYDKVAELYNMVQPGLCVIVHN